MAQGKKLSVLPAAVWWNREQLPAVETLYALTLKSALQHLEKQHRDLIPDLPDVCTARPTPQQLDDQQWCDLNEEVAPFPEATPPSPKSPPMLEPLCLHSSQQSKPETDSCDRRLSSHSGQRHDGNVVPVQVLTKRSLNNRQGESSFAGPSSVREEEERKVGECEKEKERRETDSRAPQQKEGENKKKVMEEKEEEVQRCGRGDGGGAGGRLQTCPMCLLVFPAGFTQMDCDGHLAQCLSEMNMDMTCAFIPNLFDLELMNLVEVDSAVIG
ncbi:uncharacterized protein si:ch73-70k4.1 [Scomber scombrus]|uniref:Uncharacterized protein si:ch73-70k4.1 n=1 Tax=Scomber scombrus TaxID=13677 RepID=A0AAV1PAM8_SCOSC